MNVLLIEDDNDTASYVASALRKIGYSVERTSDGETGYVARALRKIGYSVERTSDGETGRAMALARRDCAALVYSVCAGAIRIG